MQPIQSQSIQLTPSFQHALDLMEGSNTNLFITGRAGTGKSSLLNHFRGITKKNIAIVAPTGVAAVNVKGQTIHSFFSLPPKLIQKEDVNVIRSKINLMKKLDMVIIDEVSMVRADLMEGIDRSLRLHRNQRSVPFGGVQMVFFGDLYQLPPVVTRDLRTYFDSEFESPYFFSANVIRESSLEMIMLEKVFRQTDSEFIRILDNIRKGTMSDDDLNEMNTRYIIDPDPEGLDMSIFLTSKNDMAESYNRSKLREIPSDGRTYNASITGKYEVRSLPTDEMLKLKIGAQVMMLRNDYHKRWHNGTIGIITDLLDDRIFVESDGKSLEVKRETWDKIEYRYSRKTRKVDEVSLGSFKQIPVKLAWAVTIHKSQGKTFDKVVIDLGAGAFEFGQTYVALSRCTTLKGISLITPVEREDILVDERIAEFMEGLSVSAKNS